MEPIGYAVSNVKFRRTQYPHHKNQHVPEKSGITFLMQSTVAPHLTVVWFACNENGGPGILLLVVPQRYSEDTSMDPTTTFCPNVACPARGQTGQGNIG